MRARRRTRTRRTTSKPSRSAACPTLYLERFFRDEESDDGPARWTPVHLERYAKVLAADGTLERRRTVTGIARTDRRSQSSVEDDVDEDNDEALTTGDFRAKLTSRRKVLGKAQTHAGVHRLESSARRRSVRQRRPAGHEDRSGRGRLAPFLSR